MRTFILLLLFAVGFAYAGCPNLSTYPITSGEIKRVNPGWTWRTGIYFCKQDFSPAQLSTEYTPSQLSNDLNTDGTKNIPKGSAIKTNSLDISATDISKGTQWGFSTIKRPLRFFPNAGGDYGKQSLFNFYTQIRSNEACDDPSDNQYERITRYLRANPEIFVASTPSGGQQFATPPTGATNPTSGRVAYFKHFVLQESGGSELIRAEVSLERANNMSGAFFTRLTRKYCWYGVKARFKIRTNQGNSYRFEKSGDYNATLSVLVR